jgi:pimeloyl-ACP methyl ester carboxylesterase
VIQDRVDAYELTPGLPGGPLVVLVHGLEDSWETWRPLAAHLDPRWRVTALNLPWRPGNDYHWRQRRSADWLAAGLDPLGPVDAVVAHSFGANATLELMCASDARVGAAVALISPLYRPPDVAVTWSMFDEARRTFNRHMRDGLLLRLGARAATIEAPVLDIMLSKAIDRIGPAGFLVTFDQFTTSGNLPLGRIGLPSLVLAGGADPTLSRTAARALAARIPGTCLQLHDEYDHFCHVRHARDVGAQISGFIGAALAVRPARKVA